MKYESVMVAMPGFNVNGVLKIKQDACSGVHTGLKITRYVLWCKRQE